MIDTGWTKQASLLLVGLALLAFCSCVKRSMSFMPAQIVEQNITAQDATNRNPKERININEASVNQLMDLPGIGRVFADRIVGHREQYGRFRKIEHLMMVRGISERRFRKIRDLITVD